jgi:hypothetical protein
MLLLFFVIRRLAFGGATLLSNFPIAEQVDMSTRTVAPDLPSACGLPLGHPDTRILGQITGEDMLVHINK